jgi:outer membrane protein assembly factor BamB
LLAGHGYVAFVAFSGGPLSAINQLEVLDVNNGDTLWQSERFPDNEAFALSKEKAFVLLDLGMRLNIYDIGGSKEPLNSYNYFREFTQFYMFPAVVDEGENIFVYYRQGNEYLLHGINLEGAKVAGPQRIQIPVSGRHPHLLLFHNQLMLIAGMGEYVAVNFETGEELWRIQLGEEITSWPILEDGQLFIPVGTSLRSKLIAVDMETGAPLWETRKEFGSNVVLHRGKLYALRNDAVLVRLDIETGETEEEVPFEPASTDSGTWAYLLASDGERLFVYFGDSQELFALSIR